MAALWRVYGKDWAGLHLRDIPTSFLPLVKEGPAIMVLPQQGLCAVPGGTFPLNQEVQLLILGPPSHRPL